MKVYIVGMNFDNPDFEMIFEVLEEGAQFGVEYKRVPWLNVRNEKDISDGDAYVFLEMKPVERISTDKSVMYVSHNDDANIIDEKLTTFIDELQHVQHVKCKVAEPCPQQDPLEVDNDLPWVEENPLRPEEIIQGRIREVVVKIKDKTVKLNPGDIALLVKVDQFLKDNGYVIEEIIV